MRVEFHEQDDLYPVYWVGPVDTKDAPKVERDHAFAWHGGVVVEMPDDLARRALAAAEQFRAMNAELEVWWSSPAGDAAFGAMRDDG
jgi:hypothetical protein